MTENTLHIVTGKPGVGKTTYGLKLAQQNRATFLDIDTVTEPVVKAGLALAGLDVNDRDSPCFKRTFRGAIYQALFAAAEDNLTVHSVVVTGPFTKELQDPLWTQTLSSRLGCPVIVYYLCCPEAVRQQRIKQRNCGRDNAKLGQWHEHSDYYPKDRPACEHIVIESY